MKNNGMVVLQPTPASPFLARRILFKQFKPLKQFKRIERLKQLKLMKLFLGSDILILKTGCPTCSAAL